MIREKKPSTDTKTTQHQTMKTPSWIIKTIIVRIKNSVYLLYIFQLISTFFTSSFSLFFLILKFSFINLSWLVRKDSAYSSQTLCWRQSFPCPFPLKIEQDTLWRAMPLPLPFVTPSKSEIYLRFSMLSFSMFFFLLRLFA